MAGVSAAASGTREGKSSDEIADFFNNKRYPNYVTFNGDAYHRLGETVVTPPVTTLVAK